ncbi:MAG: NAD(P)/FAD-dependent oxidoreductase [Acidimicrobiales bacterium]
MTISAGDKQAREPSHRKRRPTAPGLEPHMVERSTHRVVIVGSGFGGLFAARSLRGAPVEVTIVSDRNHHLFQPLLYQVATGILSEGGIAPATRDVLRNHPAVRVQLAEVRSIDVERRMVVGERPGMTVEIPYDSLVVAAGVRTSYFGHDDFSRWAPGMKSLDDALELRGRILGAFEMAETEPDERARAAWLTFVVVGGGPTGVEMAGQLAELSSLALRRNFRVIDPASARVILVEGTGEVLATFGHRLAGVARNDLERLGVDVRTGWMVAGIDDHGVDLKSGSGAVQRIEARTKIWAAGMAASPLGRALADQTGAGLDRMGRVQVLADCTLPGHPEVFVVGDMMALDDLPGLAEVAIQSGIHAARTIRRRLDGDEGARPFHYHDLGSLAVVSRFGAVAKIRGVSISGFPAWLLWLVVHLAFLTGFKSRLAAVATWAIAFVARGRGERAFTGQQVIARHAIAALGRRVAGRGGPETVGLAGLVVAAHADDAEATGGSGGALRSVAR